MTQLKTAAKQLGMILALVGSLMFVAEMGIGTTWDLIMGNDTASGNKLGGASHSQEVTDVFGQSVDFVERTTVFLMAATLATSIGLIGISRNNPELVNSVLRYAPWLGLAVGITTFSTEIGDIIAGDFDFDAVADGYAAMVVAATGWVISGVANLLNGRN
jgi:branched-subunit amino acid permease